MGSTCPSPYFGRFDYNIRMGAMHMHLGFLTIIYSFMENNHGVADKFVFFTLVALTTQSCYATCISVCTEALHTASCKNCETSTAALHLVVIKKKG